jgi:hypothetical protein
VVFWKEPCDRKAASYRPSRVFAILALALFPPACAGSTDVVAQHGPKPLPSCDDAHLRMLLQHDRAGLLIRTFIPVEYEGRTELLLFDTGATHTHLSHGLEGPDVIKAAGSLRLGCTSLVVDSWRRRLVAGIENHRFAIGTLGTDTILAGATELDLEDGLWIRYHEGAIPREIEAWPSVPFEIVNGIPLTVVVVDERPVRLMVDTGTSYVLLLDDRVTDPTHTSITTDTFGNRVELVHGTAMLSWPGMAPERVPVQRTRSHPAFERHVRELGGGIDGILGLSVLGSHRVLIDPRRKTMRLSPPTR